MIRGKRNLEMSQPGNDSDSCPSSPLGLCLPFWEVGAYAQGMARLLAGSGSWVPLAQPLLQPYFLSDSCGSWQETRFEPAPNCSGLPDPCLSLLPLMRHSTDLPRAAARPRRGPVSGWPWHRGGGWGKLPVLAGSCHLWSRVRPGPCNPPTGLPPPLCISLCDVKSCV